MMLQLVLSATDRASAVVGRVSQSIRRLAETGQRVREVGESMARAGAALDASSQRLGAEVENLTRPAMELEDQLARLGVSLGMERAELDATRSSALEWQRAHGQAATDYIATTRELVSAGIDQAAAVEATESALRVATATGGDATATARTLAFAYRQLGDTTQPAAAEIARLGDQIARAQQLGGIADSAELVEPLREAIPVAERFRVSSEQTLAVLAQLNRAGIRGGEAGGAFRDLVTGLEELQGFEPARLADGQLDLVRTIELVRESYGDLGANATAAAKLQEQLGDSGFRSLALLTNQGELLRSTLDGVTDSTGAAEDAQRALESTSSARLRIVNAQFEVLATELGDLVLPRMIELVPAATEFVATISAWADTHPEIAGWVATVLVGALAIAGTLGPLLLMAGGLVSVGGQALEAASNVADFVERTWDFVLEAGPAAANAARSTAAALTRFGSAAAAAAARVWTLIVQSTTYALNAARAFVVGATQSAAALARQLFPATTQAVTGLVSLIRQSIAYAVTAARQFIASTIASARALATQLYSALVSAAQAVARLAAQALAFAVRAAAPFVAAVARMAASLAVQLAGAVASAAASLVAFAASAVVSAIAALDSLIASAVVTAGTMLATLAPSFVAAATAAWAFTAALLANPIVWLVGGIALAAAFAAASLAGLIYWMNPRPFDEQWSAIVEAFDAGGIAAAIEAIDLVALFDNVMTPLLTWLPDAAAGAGQGLMSTLATAIRAHASEPVDAMLDVVQRVRDLLPFSPARTGPLADLDRVQLVETVAQAVRPAPLVDAMSSAVAATRATLDAPMTVSGGGGRESASSGPMNVTIVVDGGGSDLVSALEAWIANPRNARRVRSAIDAVAARDGRATEPAT